MRATTLLCYIQICVTSRCVIKKLDCTFILVIPGGRSGSVGRLDWELKGCWFKPICRLNHNVVSLSKRLYPLLSTGSIQEDQSWNDWKIVGWEVKNQNKQTKLEIPNSLFKDKFYIKQNYNSQNIVCLYWCFTSQSIFFSHVGMFPRLNQY